MQQAQSPYDVPVMSVAVVPELSGQPLQAFERDQLKRLIQQVQAAPERVRAAFFLSMREDLSL